MEQIAEFSVVFPDEERKQPIEYLRGISRDLLLNVGAFFLGFSNQNSEFKHYRDFLSMMFRKENQAFANDVFERLKAMEAHAASENRTSRVRIINPASSLLLFELGFEYLTDEQTQTEAEAEINIFKAYLVINDQLTDKDRLARSSTKDLPEEINLAGLVFTQSYPFSDLSNYDRRELIVCQFLRACLLFDFLESREDMKGLLNAFLDYYAVDSWREYLKSLLPLAFSVIRAEREAHIDMHVEKNDNFEKSCTFIEKLSLRDDNEIGDFDFKSLRSVPFYKVDEGVYRIIYPLFVLETVFKGLYFKLSEINGKLLTQDVKKSFRGFYCDEFSERHLLYTVLNSIYANRYIEFSGDEIKATGIDAEPDYYIRNGNKAFLFESKDILIRADIKQSRDFAQYEQELGKRLYFEESNGKKKNGAVLQLINNVRRLLKQELLVDTNYKPKSLTIYPILMLHDNQYNTVGLNKILSHWFDTELQNLSAEGLQIQRVRSLTVIDIDAFIFYQDLLRDRVFKLEDLIDGYFRFVSLNKKKKYKDEEAVKQSLLPFSFYIWEVCREKWRMPKMWKDRGFDLLNV